MTQEQLTAALEAAEQEGINADEYGPYSGRFMFGEKTLAITVGSPCDAAIIGRLIGATLRTDSLGRDYVAY